MDEGAVSLHLPHRLSQIVSFLVDIQNTRRHQIGPLRIRLTQKFIFYCDGFIMVSPRVGKEPPTPGWLRHVHRSVRIDLLQNPTS
jgi:hypothetical protein